MQRACKELWKSLFFLMSQTKPARTANLRNVPAEGWQSWRWECWKSRMNMLTTMPENCFLPDCRFGFPNSASSKEPICKWRSKLLGTKLSNLCHASWHSTCTPYTPNAPHEISATRVPNRQIPWWLIYIYIIIKNMFQNISHVQHQMVSYAETLKRCSPCK